MAGVRGKTFGPVYTLRNHGTAACLRRTTKTKTKFSEAPLEGVTPVVATGTAGDGATPNVANPLANSANEKCNGIISCMRRRVWRPNYGRLRASARRHLIPQCDNRLEQNVSARHSRRRWDRKYDGRLGRVTAKFSAYQVRWSQRVGVPLGFRGQRLRRTAKIEEQEDTPRSPKCAPGTARGASYTIDTATCAAHSVSVFPRVAARNFDKTNQELLKQSPSNSSLRRVLPCRVGAAFHSLSYVVAHVLLWR